MKVLVTGGTGFVGRQVVTRLQQAGHAVRVLARHPATVANRAPGSTFQAEIHPGDVLDPSSARGACQGVEAVINLVGIISECRESTFENIHLRGTENLARAAQAAGITRFAQMSALGARPDAVARYHRSKWAAEEIVRQSGLDFTIFRPSIIYGPGDAFVNLFARMSKWSPFLPVIGSGQGTYQPLAVEWVAEAFVRSLDEPRALGRTFDLTGPEILTLPQILDQIMEVTGRRRVKVSIPLPVARMMAACLEWICPKLLHKPPPLNREQIIMLEEKTVGSPAAANDLFGLKPGTFRVGIARYVKPCA